MPARQVLCPKCKSPVIAEIEQVFDTRFMPEARDLVLSGAFNILQCPVCGTVAQVPLPIVYHDPDKELLLVYVPPELGLSRDEQEKAVGPLLRQAMKNLPPEKRKAYLLQPQYVLSLRTLQERILEAEGISKEELEAQEKRMSLLSRLISASDEARRQILEQEKDLVDEAFLDLLGYLQYVAQSTGDRVLLQRLDAIEKLLREVTPLGQILEAEEEKARRVQEFVKSLPRNLTPQAFVERLLQWPYLDRDHLALLTLVFPAILDYPVLQALQEVKETGSVEMRAKAKEVHRFLLDVLERAAKFQEEQVQSIVALLEKALELRKQGKEEEVHHLVHTLARTFQTAPSFFQDAVIQVGRRLERHPERLQAFQALLDEIEAHALSPEERLLGALLNSLDADEGVWKALVKKHAEGLTSNLLSMVTQILVDPGDYPKEQLERLFRFLSREVLKRQMTQAQSQAGQASEAGQEKGEPTKPEGPRILRPGEDVPPSGEGSGPKLWTPS